MIDKNFISLDLELNKEGNKTTDIIQVGAIVGNLKSGEILEEYEQFVKIDKKINPFITQLTGIKDEDVLHGYSLETIYQQLKELKEKHDCFRNPIVWGGGDSEELKRQLKLDDELFLFGRRWIDVKTVYISYRWSQGLNTQAGLAKAMTKLGLQFNGTKHTAKDDAKNTFIVYRKLLNCMNLQ